MVYIVVHKAKEWQQGTNEAELYLTKEEAEKAIVGIMGDMECDADEIEVYEATQRLFYLKPISAHISQ